MDGIAQVDLGLKITDGLDNCEHENTRMWEPHLAGARKCTDCGMVKNPNRLVEGKSLWFFENEIIAYETETVDVFNESIAHVVSSSLCNSMNENDYERINKLKRHVLKGSKLKIRIEVVRP